MDSISVFVPIDDEAKQAWLEYTNAIKNEEQDLIDKKVNIKTLSAKISKYTFSLAKYQGSGIEYLKSYGKEEYGYLYLEKWDTKIDDKKLNTRRLCSRKRWCRKGWGRAPRRATRRHPLHPLASTRRRSAAPTTWWWGGRCASCARAVFPRRCHPSAGLTVADASALGRWALRHRQSPGLRSGPRSHH